MGLEKTLESAARDYIERGTDPVQLKKEAEEMAAKGDTYSADCRECIVAIMGRIQREQDREAAEKLAESMGYQVTD